MKKILVHKYLILIIIIGFFLRIYDINWDQGYHLHPDERAIVMFTTPLKFPSSVDEFLSIASPLNPHFFAYGNFPLYLLKIAGNVAGTFNQSFSTYEKINLVGRFLSVIADVGTIILVWMLGRKVFSEKIGIVASFMYAVSVFPIQASHFYAVDILLTFFITATIYQLLNFYSYPSKKNAIVSGLLFGAALATKISALPLIISICLAIGVDFLLIFLKSPHKIRLWLSHVSPLMKRLATDGLLLVLSFIVSFLILQPYALIDSREFISQNLMQSQMSKNAYIFPYTLQYVGKIPYLYEIKNIFFWGLGPIATSLSLIGFFYIISLLFKSSRKSSINKELIFLSFFLVYFLIVGRFAVGWMRYMLPLYPFLALFSAYSLNLILNFLKLKFDRNYYFLFAGILIIGLLVWPISFMNIYSKPNPRYLASVWINKNIPAGKILAIEHWDDKLPLFGGEKYNFQELNLYDQPDDSLKWEKLWGKINESDYIIIASNRLYVPIQKLRDCKNFKTCFPVASQYYKKLFSEELHFTKAAEFSSYPQIPIVNYGLNDSSADESFTVYDHPKVIIFKKNEVE